MWYSISPLNSLNASSFKSSSFCSISLRNFLLLYSVYILKCEIIPDLPNMYKNAARTIRKSNEQMKTKPYSLFIISLRIAVKSTLASTFAAIPYPLTFNTSVAAFTISVVLFIWSEIRLLISL
ncbi:hypothetical protein D3C80_1769640 [compost metagenome]